MWARRDRGATNAARCEDWSAACVVTTEVYKQTFSRAQLGVWLVACGGVVRRKVDLKGAYKWLLRPWGLEANSRVLSVSPLLAGDFGQLTSTLLRVSYLT